MKARSITKLNLGCGQHILEGWINVDYSLGARMAKLPLLRWFNYKIFSTSWDKRIFLHDLRKPFPWANDSVDTIYSSHTLEHLTRDQGLHFIRECHRVIKLGGVVRIVVPDLAANIDHYLRGLTRADYFISGMEVLYSTDKNPNSSRIRKMLAPLLESPHKCYYDAPTLITILNEAGFEAANMQAFDSRIDDIYALELEDRTLHAIMIEGVKVPPGTTRQPSAAWTASESAGGQHRQGSLGSIA